MHAEEYLAFWIAGGALGMAAAMIVLHARRCLTPVTLAALLYAWAGLAVGAKWQYRLELLPTARAMDVWSTQRELLPALSGLRLRYQQEFLPLSEMFYAWPWEVFSPGRRLPLGVLYGGLLAGLWCLIVRAPWREVGDALSIGAWTMIPIGRIGCIVNGCCMGRPCSQAFPFCVSFPPDSKVFVQQLRDGLVTMTSATSVPVHPLPVYFLVAAVVTLGVLLWLLRRGAAPGMILTISCLVGPPMKVALELLRGQPRPAPLMLGIPLGVLVIVIGAVLLGRMLRLQRKARIPRLP